MKKILFIEDEQTLQKTLGDFLEREEYKAISALDGEIGLKLARIEKPDLILLDLVLPKMHGLDVLKALKEDPATRRIPVIILTNMEGIEEINKAIELGATTYLVKTSYKLEEVVKKIKKTLDE